MVAAQTDTPRPVHKEGGTNWHLPCNPKPPRLHMQSTMVPGVGYNVRWPRERHSIGNLLWACGALFYYPRTTPQFSRTRHRIPNSMLYKGVTPHAFTSQRTFDSAYPQPLHKSRSPLLYLLWTQLWRIHIPLPALKYRVQAQQSQQLW